MITVGSAANLEALAAVKQLTSINVRLLPMDEITELRVTEDAVEVWITSWKMEDRKRDIKVTGKGIRLVTLTESRPGTWQASYLTAWDREQCMEEMMWAVTRTDLAGAQLWKKLHDLLPEEPFEPFFINHYGPGQSVGEWLQQRIYERMAGRVGTDSFPMDTHQRTTRDYAAPKMVKHWN